MTEPHANHDPEPNPLAGTCLACGGPISRASEGAEWRHDHAADIDSDVVDEEILVPATPQAG